MCPCGCVPGRDSLGDIVKKMQDALDDYRVAGSLPEKLAALDDLAKAGSGIFLWANAQFSKEIKEENFNKNNKNS